MADIIIWEKQVYQIKFNTKLTFKEQADFAYRLAKLQLIIKHTVTLMYMYTIHMQVTGLATLLKL